MNSPFAGHQCYAVIPARSGSKGVPDKNIRPLAGHPLLAWSIRAAILSKYIDRVLVSTDSEAYAALARSYGAEAPFLRPAEISGDSATDLDVMQHALDWVKGEGRTVPEFLVHLRPTTPFRTPEIVDLGIKLLLDDHAATALRSVHEMPETAYKSVERNGDYLITAFSRQADMDAANGPRQSYPPTYSPNGYVDVLRTGSVIHNGCLHGDKVYGFVTPSVIEVDCENDFEFLEFEKSRRPEIIDTLFGQADVKLSN